MNREKATQGGALIVFGKKNYNNHNIFNLSINGKLKDAAKNFFNILRIIKNKKLWKQLGNLLMLLNQDWFNI